MPLRLETLGVLRLSSAGNELLRGRRKELVLLAFLARHAPRRMPREELASLLWEDRDEARSRASLRQALLQLKRVLGDHLSASPDVVGVTNAAVDLDLAEFESEAAAGRLTAAVERWQGDFLPGVESVGGEAFRQWLEAEREGFRRRLGAVLDRLAARAEQDGDHPAALAWSERWTAALPFDERALLRRCALLVRMGELPAALAAQSEYVGRLRSALDTEPSTEVQRLGLELSAAAGAIPAAQQSAALLAPELEGRGAALATLRGAWSAARAGTAELLLVEGDHGIGKSRLCEELVREAKAEHDDAVVLYGRPAAGGHQEAWSTLRRLLEPLHPARGVGAASPASLAEVSELLPALRERFTALPAPTRRTAAVEQAVEEVLRETAAERPVLLVLDDVTRADARTKTMLLRLAGAAIPRLLMVIAARTDELESQADLRKLASAASRLKLQPLSPLQVENLLHSMLTLPPDQRRTLADRLSEEAEGNPFYTVELITGLADTPLLTMDPSGSWSLSPAFLEGPAPVPSTIREAVQHRLGDLSTAARAAGVAASVLGRQVDRAVLEEVAGLSSAELARAEDELLGRRILREMPGPVVRYAFGHHFVRRVAYESLSPAERQRLHRTAAAALEKRPPGAPERADLELHRRLGMVPSRSRRWLRAAAVVLLAGTAGLGAWRLVRPQAPAADPGPPRLLVLAFANETGDPSLNSLGRIAADWISQGIARTGLVRVMPPALDSTGSEDAASYLNRVRSQSERARADLVVWGSYYWSGDSLQIQADLADVNRNESLLTLGSVRAGVHTPMPAIELLRQKTLAVLASQLDPRLAAAAAVQSSPPSYEAYKAFSEGLDSWYRRDGGPALEHFLRAYALDSTYTLPLVYAIDVHRGSGRQAQVDSLVQVLLPRRAELAPYDRAVLDLYAAHSPAERYIAAKAVVELAPGSPVAANDLPMLAIVLNRPAEAYEYLKRIDAEEGEASRLPVYWARLSAATHLLGKYEEQLEVGAQVLRRFPSDNRSYFYKVRALAGLGRLAELDAVLNESLLLKPQPHWGSPALGLFAMAHDELLAHGQPEHARVVLKRAVDAFARAPTWVQELAMHRLEMARVLAKLDRLDEARRLLEEVLAEGGALGMREPLIRGELGIVAARQRDLATVEVMDRWLTEVSTSHLGGLHTEYRAKMAAMLGRKADAMRLLQQATSEGVGFGTERHQAAEFHGLKGYAPFDAFMRPKG